MKEDPMTDNPKTPQEAAHDAHGLNLLERGRPLTDYEIRCYLADGQTGIRHATADTGTEIAAQLWERLAEARADSDAVLVISEGFLLVQGTVLRERDAALVALREALDEAQAWVTEAVRNPDADRIQATAALAKRIDRVLADTAQPAANARRQIEEAAVLPWREALAGVMPFVVVGTGGAEWQRRGDAARQAAKEQAQRLLAGESHD